MSMIGMTEETGRGNGIADCSDLTLVKGLSEAELSFENALTI